MAAKLKTTSGRITIVQEQRFRLMSDAGKSLLLTLAHDAPLEAEDLCRFRDHGTRVIVEYEGEPGLTSGVAHDLRVEGRTARGEPTMSS